MTRLKTRWRLLAALLAGGILAAGAVAVAAAQVSTPIRLAPIATDQLIASTLRAIADGRPISGHVSAHIDLGLPSLPTEGLRSDLGGAAGFLSSLSGNHRLRVWRSGDGLRVSELLPMSERSLYVNRSAAWFWDFSSFTAYVVHRPAGAPSEPFQLADPLAIARHALESVTPTTAVSVGRSVSVAGRPAYALDLEPRTAGTLVQRVEVDIDATERLPLRVAVYARGRSAAPLSVTFTQVSFAPINPATYRFSPPPGAKVRNITQSGHASGGGFGSSGGGYASGSASYGAGGYGSSGGGYASAGGGSGGSGSSSMTLPATAPLKKPLRLTHPLEQDQGVPRVFGSGWASVVAIRTPAISELRMQMAGFDITRFLPFSGPLLSIRLVDRGDHGWLLYGPVPQSTLVAVENRLH
jgi:outer membrane lipoprotein-sorting protein